MTAQDDLEAARRAYRSTPAWLEAAARAESQREAAEREDADIRSDPGPLLGLSLLPAAGGLILWAITGAEWLRPAGVVVCVLCVATTVITDVIKCRCRVCDSLRVRTLVTSPARGPLYREYHEVVCNCRRCGATYARRDRAYSY